MIFFDYVNFNRPIGQNCITKLTLRRVHSSKHTMDLPIWTLWIIHRHLCTNSLFFCSQWVEINSEGTLFFHISTFQGLLSLLYEHFIECHCPKNKNSPIELISSNYCIVLSFWKWTLLSITPYTQVHLTQIFPVIPNPTVNLDFYTKVDPGLSWVSNDR